MTFSLQFYKAEEHLKEVTTIYAHFVTKSYATFDESPFNEEEMKGKLEDIIAFYPAIVVCHSEYVSFLSFSFYLFYYTCLLKAV